MLCAISVCNETSLTGFIFKVTKQTSNTPVIVGSDRCHRRSKAGWGIDLWGGASSEDSRRRAALRRWCLRRDQMSQGSSHAEFLEEPTAASSLVLLARGLGLQGEVLVEEKGEGASSWRCQWEDMGFPHLQICALFPGKDSAWHHP